MRRRRSLYTVTSCFHINIDCNKSFEYFELLHELFFPNAILVVVVFLFCNCEFSCSISCEVEWLMPSLQFVFFRIFVILFILKSVSLMTWNNVMFDFWYSKCNASCVFNSNTIFLYSTYIDPPVPHSRTHSDAMWSDEFVNCERNALYYVFISINQPEGIRRILIMFYNFCIIWTTLYTPIIKL